MNLDKYIPRNLSRRTVDTCEFNNLQTTKDLLS